MKKKRLKKKLKKSIKNAWHWHDCATSVDAYLINELYKLNLEFPIVRETDAAKNTIAAIELLLENK